uniref:Uncharacterized protein n=1 Tax=Yersinia frederiksenii TaxID=29484 RepID=H8YUP7_YERFR|nr:hypothetical protein [Yersinia frederiksenii]
MLGFRNTHGQHFGAMFGHTKIPIENVMARNQNAEEREAIVWPPVKGLDKHSASGRGLSRVSGRSPEPHHRALAMCMLAYMLERCREVGQIFHVQGVRTSKRVTELKKPPQAICRFLDQTELPAMAGVPSLFCGERRG